jgi:DNA-directed RNA polymerase subunit beta'
MTESTEFRIPSPATAGPPIPAMREREKETRRRFDFTMIRIQLASPEIIRGWSHGEVTKPETINYRTFRPERDGLFCERIFGPVKDWQCGCGRYKMIRYRGVICDKCGVEVTRSNVRRERMGHIDLAVPVSHIWYFKGVPSRIGHLLDMPVRQLERILYYESYVMVEPGNTPYKYKELISEEQYHELVQDASYNFEAMMGAEAIRHLLTSMDLEELSPELRNRARVETSVQRKKDLLKRLKVVEAFRHSGNKPGWMILEAVPVLPPDLRPLVPLEGGRFATSDLNDLYRRVINRNNRLKRLMDIRAPEVILRNEKRMLQEAVDALFDNGRRTRAVRGQGNRPLKSLSDMLKGKQGRFRQNLLGKRVDYSGRSVIVVGPELKLHQCGLPQTMALELFKPFIIRQLEDGPHNMTVKSAKRFVEREHPEVWEVLSKIIKDHPILLNRAPTLHRLGIQAFQPVLVEGKAIRLHPLACAAFNADFDGDQMAVHVPLSWTAQIESRELMLSTNNILLPANGRPVATPSQDIVLGCNYMTKPKDGVMGEGMIFADPDEVVHAHQHDRVALHARIKCRVKGEMYDTTVGRVIFNQTVPAEVPFYNDTLDKRRLERLVSHSYRLLGKRPTAKFLDRLKDLGFTWATRAGITVGIDDIVVPEKKQVIIDDASKEVASINREHKNQKISERERQNRVIETWTRVRNEVEEVTMEGLAAIDNGFNPIWLMADSGARGSREQIRQLAGMRGLMAKPQKRLTGGASEVIEQPVLHNFREGLTVLEYFISTHGARKGLADTALKTADAGYLTRRLVDVAQDVIVTQESCGTIRGIERGALKDGEQIVEPLKDRLLGRVTVDDVYDPASDELICESGDLIDEVLAERIDTAGVDKVFIRSVLTCESRRGICAKCYGRDLSAGVLVSLGEAVGVIAAQSIGEPGTQLTLRTFHIGGTAALVVSSSMVRARREGKVQFVDMKIITRKDGTMINIARRGLVELIDEQKRVIDRFTPGYGTMMRVKDKEKVKSNIILFEWDTYNVPIVSAIAGRVRFVDIKDRVTLRDQVDETTNKRELVIVEDREKRLHPHIDVISTKGGKPQRNAIPTGARLIVRDGAKISEGETMATLRRAAGMTRDITAGLPRVSELFEARRPKDQATISEIDGIVSMGKLTRGLRKVVVEAEDGGDTRDYLIPHGKHLHVEEGDFVRAGQPMTDGAVNPHDILRVKGIKEVQEYLVDQIQEVYRTQGVPIDDKHIEVIVRQMLLKVRIEDTGDTRFLEGELVDKIVLKEEQQSVEEEGGNPAQYAPLLLGITKASLSTHSFVSAASFQETTRILTEASINGSLDPLRGLKENVAIGQLIPAGTGMATLRGMKSIPLDVEPEEEEEELLLEFPSILEPTIRGETLINEDFNPSDDDSGS